MTILPIKSEKNGGNFGGIALIWNKLKSNLQ